MSILGTHQTDQKADQISGDGRIIDSFNIVLGALPEALALDNRHPR